MKIRLKIFAIFLAAVFAYTGLAARAQDAAAVATLATPDEAAASSAPATKASSWGVPPGRTFFPHNWLRGYVNFDVAPPHNEPDLGRCTQNATIIAAAGGVNSPCTAYARYLMGGYLEIQPFGRTIARHLFVFWTPTFSLGSNVPQYKYTASMAGIAYERAFGIGFELPKNFEVRVEQHQVDWLGKFKGAIDPAIQGLDLGTAGPYGLYSTIGARWYFGGYGRSREGR